MKLYVRSRIVFNIDVCTSSKFMYLRSLRYFLTPELILINKYEAYIFFYLFDNNKNMRTV